MMICTTPDGIYSAIAFNEPAETEKFLRIFAWMMRGYEYRSC